MSLNVRILRDIILSEPSNTGASDADVATWLNATVPMVSRDTVSAADIFEQIDPAEFTALSAAQQARVDRILGLGSGISTVPGSQARAELVAVFGGGSTTITNLAALIGARSISRASLAGQDTVDANDVTTARAMVR